MKRITRMLVFSAVSLYVTSFWNKGFIIPTDWMTFLKAAVLIAIIYYLIGPITKIILLPLNILTLGFISFVAYSIIFYLIMVKFPFIQIKSWEFPGLTLYGVTISRTNINPLLNVFFSSFSISFIINLLETVI